MARLALVFLPLPFSVRQSSGLGGTLLSCSLTNRIIEKTRTNMSAAEVEDVYNEDKEHDEQ